MDRVIKYLMAELDIKEHAAKEIAANFESHPDIKAELESWIATKAFPKSNAVTAEGYTADDIMRLAPHMNGVGAYNFLVTLRERPENGKRIISEGFRLHTVILPPDFLNS